MYYTYVLRSLKDEGLYIGYTANMDQRYRDHRRGKVRSTKGRRPLMLVYWEEFYCIEEAKEWERYLKTSAGRRYIKGVINGGRRKVVTG